VKWRIPEASSERRGKHASFSMELGFVRSSNSGTASIMREK